MKKTILAILLAAGVLTLGPTVSHAQDIPIEAGAVIGNQTPHSAAQAGARLVRAYGYRCDSISAFRPMIFSTGFVLHCNRYRYTYDIKDVGGHWRVYVD